MTQRYNNSIDRDKLKQFISGAYWSIKRFALMAGYTYQHFNDAINNNNDALVTELMMKRIINTINNWYGVDKFHFKPTTEVKEIYFYKKV